MPAEQVDVGIVDEADRLHRSSERLLAEITVEFDKRCWSPKPGDVVVAISAYNCEIKRDPSVRSKACAHLSWSDEYLIIAVTHPKPVRQSKKYKWCLILGGGTFGWVKDFYLRQGLVYLPQNAL